MPETGLDAADVRLLRAAGVTGRPHAERVAGGFANDVLLVRAGSHRVALRRWVREPESAAVEIGALAEAAADGLPVPEVLAADGDRAVLSWVPGVRGDVVLAESRPESARQVGTLLGALALRVAARDRAAAGTVTFHDGHALVKPWPMSGAELLRHLLELATEAPGGWRDWAGQFAAELGSVNTGTQRVHSDFNPKNVLLRPDGADGWRVAALLDWEFTFAGPQEVDVGNMLRFEPRAEPEPFGLGVREGLGGLSDARLRQARVLDLLALCGFLTPLPPGKPDHPIRQAVRELAATQLATGRL